MKTNILTRDRLKALLTYDLVDGVFVWRVRRGQIARGTVAGNIHAADGYRYIKIDNVLYRASRLAWLYVNGEWPRGHIDHLNRNTSDDRMCNLRDCSRQQNQANRKLNKNSTTKFKGVCRRGQKFIAYINKDGKRYSLGNYDTAEQAHAVRVAAAKALHGEFMRVA